MRITYTVGIDDSHYDLDTRWDEESIDYMASDAAEDYFTNHDGFEASWPLNFEIFIDNVSQGIHEVEFENTPTFTATKL
jgi:hypothetical protein